MGRRGDAGTRGRGDGETRGRGDGGTGRQGDAGMRGHRYPRIQVYRYERNERRKRKRHGQCLFHQFDSLTAYRTGGTAKPLTVFKHSNSGKVITRVGRAKAQRNA